LFDLITITVKILFFVFTIVFRIILGNIDYDTRVEALHEAVTISNPNLDQKLVLVMECVRLSPDEKIAECNQHHPLNMAKDEHQTVDAIERAYVVVAVIMNDRSRRRMWQTSHLF
jgi:hypothetical protein